MAGWWGGGGIGHFCGVLAPVHGGRSGSWNKFDTIGSNHRLGLRIYRLLKEVVSFSLRTNLLVAEVLSLLVYCRYLPKREMEQDHFSNNYSANICFGSY
jgi:hypothetical protein